MTAIRLDDVTVYYRMTVSGEQPLRRRILTGLGRKRFSDRSERLTALNAISLHVEQGTRLAVIGGNGAGKSTLLRVMAGSLPPRSGLVSIKGKALSLLGGAGAGLDPNLTGYDNIIVMGVMLGERPRRMKERMEEIADFSGLGERLRNPVSTYSSGMNARLRFSVLMTMSPQILIMDEGVATADAVFAQKAADRLREFHDQAEIVVMSSHGSRITDSVDQVLWLEDGSIRQFGLPDEVMPSYSEWVKEQVARAEVTSRNPVDL